MRLQPRELNPFRYALREVAEVSGMAVCYLFFGRFTAGLLLKRNLHAWPAEHQFPRLGACWNDGQIGWPAKLSALDSAV